MTCSRMPAPDPRDAMKFTGLRLSGFKSFVDPVEIGIHDGLTGIVGPNGCGKSNIVEAMRWVMGEASALRMRGSEMEDVIFSGNARRPGSNTAEVTLVLDNSDRRAPAAFNDAPELNVTRRIDRGSGSQYRINGQDARSRDVQLLFADAGSGARSSGIVSQGQIGTLINARPAERRILLEEAAGTRGLQSRRHEAELRLRAAESNLERLGDVILTLNGQLGALRRQAGQATRYRELSERIREAESVLLRNRWNRLQSRQDGAALSLADIRRKIGEAIRVAGAESAERARLAAVLPDLRNAEVTCAARLQRLTLALAELDNEEQRIVRSREEAETRQRQFARDIERERSLHEEAGRNGGALEEERKCLVALQETESARAATALSQRDSARAVVDSIEAGVAALAGSIAEVEARRNSLEHQLHQVRERERRLQRHLENLQSEIAARTEEFVEQQEVERARAEADMLLRSVGDAASAVDRIEKERAEQAVDVDDRRAALRAISAETAALTAEADMLQKLLAENLDAGIAPAIDRLEVAAGYEVALGAALGDNLSAPITVSCAGDRRWTGRSGGVRQTLPGSAIGLDSVIVSPPELRDRLSQVGVVPDAESAARLQPLLAAGQRLTTPEGGLWRWDGYVVAVGTPDSMAIRARQRNRKADIETALSTLATRSAQHQSGIDSASATLDCLIERESRARQARRDAEQQAEAARGRAANLAARRLEEESRLRGLAESRSRAADEREEINGQTRMVEAELAILPEVGALKEQLETERGLLAGARDRLAAALTEHDRLGQEAQQRRARLHAIASEIGDWSRRSANAVDRVADLQQRQARETVQLRELTTRPVQIETQRTRLGETRRGVEGERRLAADRLAEMEASLAEADRSARQADKQVAALREERVRTEATLDHIASEQAALRARILERLDCDPEQFPVSDGLDDAEQGSGVNEEEVTERFERLVRARDRIGPVNLRAETEARELGEKIIEMESERDDLSNAVAALRRAIGNLNRQGRERLTAAFTTLNVHFSDLFTRLFGGGKGYLTLIEGEDPLDVGLEIMASPPGKSLRRLTLLSGGEQALTGLALVFAGLLANPSPVCVLDEVDAPLDDNNVGRFCDLLESMVQTAGTRFLIITHHRLTMARVNRLFGVTMAERGISQLVSVDLGQAERLRETA